MAKTRQAKFQRGDLLPEHQGLRRHTEITDDDTFADLERDDAERAASQAARDRYGLGAATARSQTAG